MGAGHVPVCSAGSEAQIHAEWDLGWAEGRSMLYVAISQPNADEDWTYDMPWQRDELMHTKPENRGHSGEEAVE